MVLLSILMIMAVIGIIGVATTLKDPIVKQVTVIIASLLSLVILIFAPWEVKIIAVALPLMIETGLALL